LGRVLEEIQFDVTDCANTLPDPWSCQLRRIVLWSTLDGDYGETRAECPWGSEVDGPWSKTLASVVMKLRGSEKAQRAEAARFLEQEQA
jgi:hypothetical protein